MAYSYRNIKPEDKLSASSWSINYLLRVIYKYCLFTALQSLEFPSEFKILIQIAGCMSLAKSLHLAQISYLIYQVKTST